MSSIQVAPASDGSCSLSPSRSIWACPSIRPGIAVRPARSMCSTPDPAAAATVAPSPTARMRSPEIAIASAMVPCGSSVTILPPLKIRLCAFSFTVLLALLSVRIRGSVDETCQSLRSPARSFGLKTIMASRPSAITKVIWANAIPQATALSPPDKSRIAPITNGPTKPPA